MGARIAVTFGGTWPRCTFELASGIARSSALLRCDYLHHLGL